MSKVSLITSLGAIYLGHALGKLGTEPHPNFVRVASKNTLLTYAAIREAVNSSVDSNPKVHTVKALKRLAEDARAYTQFLKDLMSNAAFLGAIEWNKLARAALPQDQVDRLSEDMLGMEVHPYEPGDMPLFDQSAAIEAKEQRERVTEEFRNEPEDIYAKSQEEIEETLDNLQGWLGLALGPMRQNQLEYWGLTDGVPFGQRKIESSVTGEVVYEPIMKFDEYREWSLAEFKKRNKIAVKPDEIDLMMAG